MTAITELAVIPNLPSTSMISTKCNPTLHILSRNCLTPSSQLVLFKNLRINFRTSLITFRPTNRTIIAMTSFTRKSSTVGKESSKYFTIVSQDQKVTLSVTTSVTLSVRFCANINLSIHLLQFFLYFTHSEDG